MSLVAVKSRPIADSLFPFPFLSCAPCVPRCGRILARQVVKKGRQLGVINVPEMIVIYSRPPPQSHIAIFLPWSYLFISSCVYVPVLLRDIFQFVFDSQMFCYKFRMSCGIHTTSTEHFSFFSLIKLSLFERVLLFESATSMLNPSYRNH